MRPRVQTASATTAHHVLLRRTKMLHAHVQARAHPHSHALFAYRPCGFRLTWCRRPGFTITMTTMGPLYRAILRLVPAPGKEGKGKAIGYTNGKYFQKSSKWWLYMVNLLGH